MTTTTQTAPATTAPASIRCPLHGGNEHPDGSCTDERDRPLCADGRRLCEICRERGADVINEGEFAEPVCGQCVAEVVAEETKRRAGKLDALQRAWLEAGAVIRAERARGEAA